MTEPMSDATSSRTTEPEQRTEVRSPSPRTWLADRLFSGTAIGPLVQARVALGLILVWEAYRYLSYNWPRTLFLEPPFLFKYQGFEWVRPLPEAIHLAVVPTLGVLAVAFTVGLFYRIAAGLLFFGWAYIFLLDQALYLNHLYLVVVLIGLMALLPAHRAFSIDAWWRPGLYANTVPQWTIDLLRFQIGIVYFFGGVAKLNLDWLTGVPMQMMLLGSPHLFGSWAGEPAFALVFAYSGLLLDLFIVPLLCWRKTRLFALLLATIFHVTNHILFQIGIFPWTMLAATFILWPPARMTMLGFARLCGGLVAAGMLITAVFHPPGDPSIPVEPWAWGAVIVLGALLAFPPDSWHAFPFERFGKVAPEQFPRRPAVMILLGLFAIWQIGMPLRHFLYPGDASWHEQGHKWSWHMKLRVKVADEATFQVRDESGKLLQVVDPFSSTSRLTPRQAETMSTRPDMALKFAHDIAHRSQDHYGHPVRVTMENRVSLNGRPFQHLIDPQANLALIEDRFWRPAEWILPLTTPRRPLTRVNPQRVQSLFDYIEVGQGDAESK